LNVGRISGGLNTNSVPDKAEFEVDIRTIPDQDHADIVKMLCSHTNGEIGFEYMADLPAVFTNEQEEWAQKTKYCVEQLTGTKIDFGAANYFTDASILTPALDNPPTIILGPGDAALAHVTDEYCLVSKLQEAEKIYSKLISEWCHS
jgi:succinyl-diaminopimelate desuccinylase